MEICLASCSWDASKSGGKYGAASADVVLPASDGVPEDHRFKEDGICFRRRSKSDHGLVLASALGEAKKRPATQTEVRPSESNQPPLERERSCEERPKGHHGSKRSSFEAGFGQAPDSSRKSAEKIQRQSTDDFLPAELVQRSRLFNGSD